MAKYTHLIPQNIATSDVNQINIYNRSGKHVGIIPLNNLSFSKINSGKKLYSFGCLSDIHIVYDTAADDFKRALTFFNNMNVDFICICGDLGSQGVESELQYYKSLVDNYSNNIPIYAIAGNHEHYQERSYEYLEKYTGYPLYYTIERGDDVFIMLGVISGTQGNFFETSALQWLYETLEKNRNKRCFLFEHVLLDDSSGDILNLYGSKITYDTTEGTVFKSLLSHYHNLTFFHGHSHMRFYLQEYGPSANYDYSYNCHSVHIPSCAVPRDINSTETGTDYYYAGSEGYLIEAYENGILLRGYDFIKGQFLPIANYWLDTTLQTIEANTYTDNTGTIQTASAILGTTALGSIILGGK